MSDFKYNAKAIVYYTVGLSCSACVTQIEERWMDGSDCDVVATDIKEGGAVDTLECMGVDMYKEGSFKAEVKVMAYEDESPDYEIICITERVVSELLKGRIK